MAASLAMRGDARGRSIGADGYERLLAGAGGIVFLATLAAIARGHADWRMVPAIVWLHLATVLLATGLTPVILLGRRGTRRHRLLGRLWVCAMLATALLSVGITAIQPGHWSWIHLLSLYVLAQAPVIWWSARTHRIDRHRRAVRGMVTGALVIAGAFTFPFGRLLGHWLFA